MILDYLRYSIQRKTAQNLLSHPISVGILGHKPRALLIAEPHLTRTATQTTTLNIRTRGSMKLQNQNDDCCPCCGIILV